MFDNMQALSRNATPRTGPFNYDVYDVGPENARIELYRKHDDGRLIVFSCLIPNIRWQRSGLCDDFVELDDDNTVRLRFGLDQVEYVPEIEAGIRKLMNGFKAIGADP
jgi:hypothetical protein